MIRLNYRLTELFLKSKFRSPFDPEFTQLQLIQQNIRVIMPAIVRRARCLNRWKYCFDRSTFQISEKNVKKSNAINDAAVIAMIMKAD